MVRLLVTNAPGHKSGYNAAQVEERDVLTRRCHHDATRATTIPSWPNRSRTVAAFSARLRREIDLDSLAELLAVVDQTMQPTRASLRPRPSAHPWPPSGSPSDETDIRRERRSPGVHPLLRRYSPPKYFAT